MSGDEDAYDTLLENVHRDTVLCSYLLNRLQLSIMDYLPPVLQYECFTLDLSEFYPVLDYIPLGLVTVPFKGSRSYTMDEITLALNDLQSEHHKLRDATVQCSRRSRLLGLALSCFTGRQRYGSKSNWGKKWQWACHRVVLQNQVSRIKERLNTLDIY